MTWLSNHWRLTIFLLVVLAIVGYGVFTYGSNYLAIYKLHKEQAQVIANKDKEIATLNKQKLVVQQQLIKVKKERDEYVAKLTAIERKLYDLEDKIAHIDSPADLDALVSDLQRRGYGSARRAPPPK
jgi:septal ring factor EnvC (AmiA/AmiB activator)